ncbi:phosphoribulokinase [soil metagenome]
MPDKLIHMRRAQPGTRPRMLAIAGDSAAGKTTLSKGLVKALGRDRATVVAVDDYHRYDRQERKELPFTPLHPDCNYIEVMEQHLQLLATGQPILKPVYDHSNGTLVRPELIEPTDYIIVEGLLPLHTKLARACFDVTVYLDPPEDIRHRWKVDRDTRERGYTEEEVRASLDKREPESAAFIHPQRALADIVVRFGPIDDRGDEAGTPLSATLLLRPTIPHPDLSDGLSAETSTDGRPAMHLKLMRDEGRPVDALHIHGYAPREDTQATKKLLWEELDRDHPLPDSLGDLGGGKGSSEPLAITQLMLLYHLLRIAE